MSTAAAVQSGNTREKLLWFGNPKSYSIFTLVVKDDFGSPYPSTVLGSVG